MQFLQDQYKQFVREFETKIYSTKKNILFLGIGTNKVVGDCFGPLVGSYLKYMTRKYPNIYVKGTMKYPITKHAIMRLKHKKNIDVVAIDSAMIDGKRIGDIFVTKSPIILAEAVGNPFIQVGDYAIKASIGINSESKQKNIEELKRVPKYRVAQLANIVASGINEVIKKRS